MRAYSRDNGKTYPGKETIQRRPTAQARILDGGLVSYWHHGLWRVVGCRHDVCRAREDGDALQLDALALGLGLCVQVVVALDAVEELLPALGVPDVLNTDVDPLLDVAVADDLVDNDADGTWGDVVDDTGPASTHKMRCSSPPARQTYRNHGRTRGSTCGACPSAGPHSP